MSIISTERTWAVRVDTIPPRVVDHTGITPDMYAPGVKVLPKPFPNVNAARLYASQCIIKEYKTEELQRYVKKAEKFISELNEERPEEFL